uniref:AAA+ ATPase domain-containing protein n=2 Tax=Aegilops tauschii subsp. strangulata TaxID=200361 RepID=A0A452ZW87_AEGTS
PRSRFYGLIAGRAARGAARAGGGQADSVRAARHRPVPRDGRRQQRHRRLHHGEQLLRAHPQHHRPRAAQALRLRRAPPPLQRARRRPPARGRLQRLAARCSPPPRSPNVLYSDIGGCGIQKQEIREAVELPLTHHELYKQIGIDPPRGVLLYGPPGTGKTMLAKAVAHHTTAAFIRVVGSEFVQKYLGEGPRMVRDVFRLAKENGPAIIFIDEVDAIATARFDAQTGADREVQRILMELLNQMDGFDQTVNVKVIMATNRADTLDPALLRPGRLDRKIEFPLPDRRQKRLVFQVCTAKMDLSDGVDLEDYVSRPDKISAADMAAICQEAGMHAVRKNRYVILPKDFEKGYRTNVKKPETDFDLYK